MTDITPTVDVATLLDRSRDWVSYHRRRLGIGTYIGRVWMFSDDEIEQLRQILEGGDDPALIRARVLALHRAGVRRAAIAAHYDVDSRTISRWISQARAEEDANQHANQHE